MRADLGVRAATPAGTATCPGVLEANYERIAHRVPDDVELSAARRA